MTSPDDLDLISAILLSILEGLTEFIPVSSTGHLILLGDALNFTGPQAESFSIFIQLGAILAVVWLYWKRFREFLVLNNYRAPTFRLHCYTLGIACLPVLICGALFHSKIKELLFTPVTVAAALIVGGILLILVDRRDQEPNTTDVDSVSYRQAVQIGLFQCLALWPGMSRSGSCIIGGRLCGLSNVIAAEFSFIVAVPVMIAAVGYDMLKSFSQFSPDNLTILMIGFVVAGFTAVLAIKFFLKLLASWNLAPFGWYRIILGILVLALL
ncbi:MAG: undecaprenyl-diphosphate phosphatase [Bdellovibrionales bacterium]|nr:undecaprenyl-diphosphate phosphatase [Bdellovibrionales bacterium]